MIERTACLPRLEDGRANAKRRSQLTGSFVWKLSLWWRGILTRVPCHWGNYVSISFHIEWDMIIVTVFLSILNRMEFHLVQNLNENCHHDHIPFNMKGNGKIIFSAWSLWNSQNEAALCIIFNCMSIIYLTWPEAEKLMKLSSNREVAFHSQCSVCSRMLILWRLL